MFTLNLTHLYNYSLYRYFGRKIIWDDELPLEERLIGDYKHIYKPGYTYWCVAYAMTRRGLQKLIDQKPLSKMIPTDEFIPIMFNQHPK